MVWLILLAVAVGILAGFWVGPLYAVFLVLLLVGLVVAVEESRTRRRRGLGDRSGHFDANKHQFVNYTDRRGVDVPTALSDTPSRGPGGTGVNIEEGDKAP